MIAVQLLQTLIILLSRKVGLFDSHFVYLNGFSKAYLIWRWRFLIRIVGVAETGPVRLRFVKQGDIIRSGRF